MQYAFVAAQLNDNNSEDCGLRAHITTCLHLHALTSMQDARQEMRLIDKACILRLLFAKYFLKINILEEKKMFPCMISVEF